MTTLSKNITIIILKCNYGNILTENPPYATANSNNSSTIIGGNTITISGVNNHESRVLLIFNGVDIIIETLPDPNLKIARALVACYLAEEGGEAPRSKSLISLRFCNTIQTDQEIVSLKECIEEHLQQIGQKPEDATKVITFLRGYIYSSSLFEVLGVVKKIPENHVSGIFNQNISFNVLKYLTTDDINYPVDHPPVVISGNNNEEGE